jgi:pyruvate-ferredoxin/flavodoxin oxidoreductase
LAFRNGPIEDVHAGVECQLALENPSIRFTKHALNVHCGHDDVYGALDTGWIIGFGKDQQAADQALILRRVSEPSLTPAMNVQDGFLTSHTASTIPPYALDH